MQSGRNNRLDGRVPIPINRAPAGYPSKTAKNVGGEKKKQQVQPVGKAGAASVINLPDDNKVKPVQKANNVSNIPKVRVVKAADNRVSPSIQKLFSVYENGSTGTGRVPDDRKAKLYGRAATRIPPLGKKVDIRQSRIPGDWRKIPQKTKTPADSITESMIVTTMDKKNSESTAEQLIPIMTPEQPASVSIINSIIKGYMQEKAEDRPLNFLLSGCEDKSVFPVCSKKATDNIPSSESTAVVQDGSTEDKSDFIVMLRRRNSEPYSPKDCLLQYSDADNRMIQNYFFWEPGPMQHLKPYWEVSLFKSNRSLSVLSSRVASGMLSLTPPSTEIIPGQFRKAETKPSWLREVSSVSDDHLQTLPFITLMEKGRVLSREPEVKTQQDRRPPSPRRRQPRVFSKDDQYKPPGHLLVFVKSSQKKLVTVEGHPENAANKKVHKLTKIRRINSDVRHSPWHSRLLVAAATVVFLVIGAVVFLVYFLTKRHSVFNLTPPIPGLVRGC